MGIEAMSPYERKAWERALREVHASPRGPRLPLRVRELANKAKTNVAAGAAALPGASAAAEIAQRAMDGTLALTFQPALYSARSSSTIAYYSKRDPSVSSMTDVRALPLEVLDGGQPNKLLYASSSAAQGGATALIVTGTEVATTVSAGAAAGTVIAAVAADSVASLAMMGRTVGQIASRYGYDPRLPDEELFAMGVLSLGLVGSISAKTQALSALSRLTQQMMRRATWQQLNEHLLAKVIIKVYEGLGLKLTQRKLGQAVPVVGVGLNAVLSAQLVEQTFRRAQAVYRLRHLSEKYDIDPATWMEGAPSIQTAEDGKETVIDVAQILDDEEEHEDES